MHPKFRGWPRALGVVGCWGVRAGSEGGLGQLARFWRARLGEHKLGVIRNKTVGPLHECCYFYKF